CLRAGALRLRLASGRAPPAPRPAGRSRATLRLRGHPASARDVGASRFTGGDGEGGRHGQRHRRLPGRGPRARARRARPSRRRPALSVTWEDVTWTGRVATATNLRDPPHLPSGCGGVGGTGMISVRRALFVGHIAAPTLIAPTQAPSPRAASPPMQYGVNVHF